MGMTIEQIKAKLDKSNLDSDTLIELTRYLEKYQKIEDIALGIADGDYLRMNRIREIIEDDRN